MATHANSKDLILITGGTGKTGRRVAERLIAAGKPVRIGSRSANPSFDWENPAGWAKALDGVNAVYASYQPDLAVPGGLETVTAFFKQAVASGARRIVLLSGRGEPEAEDAEQALIASGADWTILRSSWFSQNFSESFFLEPVLSGVVALPVKPVAEPFVDVEDIAEMAAAAFTDSRHSGQLYDITGPKAVTFEEAVQEIAHATGRKIDFVRISAEQYREECERAQVPKEYIDLVLYLFTTVLDGRNTPTADGVQRALGKPARSFSDFVRRTAATGVWGSAG